jgi:hypothetical protein
MHRTVYALSKLHWAMQGDKCALSSMHGEQCASGSMHGELCALGSMHCV